MRKIYSHNDFDPQTRLYLMDGETLKGFITAKTVPKQTEDELFLENTNQTAIMMVPLTFPHTEEWDRLLMEKELEVFQSKDTSTVVCNIGTTWGKADIATEFGFRPKFNLLVEASCTPEQLSSSEPSDCIVPFSMDMHGSQVASILSQHLGYSEQTALSILQSPPDTYNIKGSFCYVENNRVEGWIRVSEVDGQWQMGPPYPADITRKDVIDLLLAKVANMMQVHQVAIIYILCGKHGQHLLQLIDHISFKPAIISYELAL